MSNTNPLRVLLLTTLGLTAASAGLTAAGALVCKPLLFWGGLCAGLAAWLWFFECLGFGNPYPQEWRG